MNMYATIEDSTLKLKGSEKWIPQVSEAISLCVRSGGILHAVLRRREHHFTRYGYFNEYWQVEAIEYSGMMTMSDLVAVITKKLSDISVVLKMVSLDAFLNAREN